jgi:hypothetical protein
VHHRGALQKSNRTLWGMMSGKFLTAVANRCRPYMDVSRSHPTNSIRGNVFGITGMGMAAVCIAVDVVVESWDFNLDEMGGRRLRLTGQRVVLHGQDHDGVRRRQESRGKHDQGDRGRRILSATLQE